MGRLEFPPQARIALDTSAIIYSVEKVQPYFELLTPLWLGAQQGKYVLYGSELLLLEVLVKPFQRQDLVLETAFRQLLTNSRELSLLPLSRTVSERAGRLRAEHGIKTPDAIHLATALLAGCNFVVTNDSAWRKVASINVTLLDDHLLN